VDRKASHEIAAALRRFPHRTEQVALLSSRDEAFRDMCEELAAADEALSRLEADRTAAGAARRAECEGWITRLIEEMGATLDRADIIPLPSTRPRR
jgi:hypothetical protein